MFNAALLERYWTACKLYAIISGFRRSSMEPMPVLTLMMRGVVLDFLSSGAKYSTVSQGPVELVAYAAAICCVKGMSSGNIATAALFTSASSLTSRSAGCCWLGGNSSVRQSLPAVLALQRFCCSFDRLLARNIKLQQLHCTWLLLRFENFHSSLALLS